MKLSEINDYHRKLYERDAKKYEKATESFFMDRSFVVFNRCWDLAKKRFPTESGVSVFDAGCGPGRDFIHLKETAAMAGFKNVSFYGCDISKRFVDIAKKKLPAVSVQIGDMKEICFGVFSVKRFHILWIHFSLIHLPKAYIPDYLFALRKVTHEKGIWCLGYKRGDGEGWQDTRKVAKGKRYFTMLRRKELSEEVERHGMRVDPLDIIWENRSEPWEKPYDYAWLFATAQIEGRTLL